MTEFTSLQGQYLAFIDGYGRIHGRAPAESDLQRFFGVTPPSVHQMILTLERKGLISRVPGVARSITLRVPSADLPPLAPEGVHRERQTTSAPSPDHRPLPAKNAKRASPSALVPRPKPDPVLEYVDSMLMTQRVRHGRLVSALIHGRHGVYRTQTRLTRRVDGDCTCPSDGWPCKHVRALRATWEQNPGSFFDVQAFLRSLATREKAELVEAISRIVAHYPQALALLGVPGFDDEDTDPDMRTD